MIKRATDIKELRQAFYSVFKSRDPFEPAWQVDLPIKIVLFPTDSYHLTFGQFQALIGALLSCGERKFFISEIEGESDPFDTGYHWVCEEPNFTEYTNLTVGIENSIYSLSCSWGILLSQELHALLVCDYSFWNAFQKQYPNWGQDREEFIKYWSDNEKAYGSDISWLQDFLDSLRPPATEKPEI